MINSFQGDTSVCCCSCCCWCARAASSSSGSMVLFLGGHGGLAAAFAGGEGGFVALLDFAVAEDQGSQHGGDGEHGDAGVAVAQEAAVKNSSPATSATSASDHRIR